MSPVPDTQVAIEALAALEMDQLERAVKLAGTAAETALSS
jgi:hypothetical protein